MARRVATWYATEITATERAEIDATDATLDGSGTAIQRMTALETQVKKLSRIVRLMAGSLAVGE